MTANDPRRSELAEKVPAKRIVRRTVGVLLGIIALAFILLAITFLPSRIESEEAEVGALPDASPPASMSISALPTGTYETPALFAFRGGALSDLRQFAATSVLVRHPKGDLLIDAGFGKRVDTHLQLIPAVQRSPHIKGTSVFDQLAATGFDPRKLAGIIPTHAHWDHVSGVDDLRGVPVMLNAAGRATIAAKAKGTEVINSISGVNYRSYRFEGGAYLGFTRNHDVWGDGSVVVVPAPGHTADSVIVFVNLPSGKRFAFIGDLVWQSDGIELPAEKPWMLRWMIGEDKSEIRKDINLIRTAIRKYPQMKAIPAHDTRAFRALPIYPDAVR